jgi:hypothetical protein
MIAEYQIINPDEQGIDITGINGVNNPFKTVKYQCYTDYRKNKIMGNAEKFPVVFVPGKQQLNCNKYRIEADQKRLLRQGVVKDNGQDQQEKKEKDCDGISRPLTGDCIREPHLQSLRNALARAFSLLESCRGFPFLRGVASSSSSASPPSNDGSFRMSARRKSSAGAGMDPEAHAWFAMSLSDETTIH